MSARDFAGGWPGPDTGHPPRLRKILKTPAALWLPHRVALPVRLHEVTRGGASVVAPLNLKRSTACEVRFHLAWPPERGRHAVAARATVDHSILSRRQGGFVIGLAFTALDDHALELISRLVGG